VHATVGSFEESKHVNRKKFHGEYDPRVAVLSNDPKHGLVSVGEATPLARY